MDIISKIEKLRVERGWSEYELAQQSLITQSTLASYKQRKTPPKIETLQALCDAFGISLAQFFLEDEQVEIVSYNEKELLSIYRSLPENKKQALLNLIK